jgi:hypothetical protein
VTDEQGVVIVDAAGAEHHFPAGFDPVKAGAIVRQQTQAHPPSAEDFMKPDDIANRDNGTSIAGDLLKGAAKGLGRSVVGLAKTAASSAIPGAGFLGDEFNPVLRSAAPVLRRADAALVPTNDAQKVGGSVAGTRSCISCEEFRRGRADAVRRGHASGAWGGLPSWRASVVVGGAQRRGRVRAISGK